MKAENSNIVFRRNLKSDLEKNKSNEIQNTTSHYITLQNNNSKEISDNTENVQIEGSGFLKKKKYILIIGIILWLIILIGLVVFFIIKNKKNLMIQSHLSHLLMKINQFQRQLILFIQNHLIFKVNLLLNWMRKI